MRKKGTVPPKSHNPPDKEVDLRMQGAAQICVKQGQCRGRLMVYVHLCAGTIAIVCPTTTPGQYSEAP